MTWFEEPVSSDDLAGLRAGPGPLDGDVAAGEYGYTLDYFATDDRGWGCGLPAGRRHALRRLHRVAGRSPPWPRPTPGQVSAHCAPNLHAPVAAAVPNLRHIEYFHDHHRIETMLFEGTLSPNGGAMTPDSSRPGHGLSFREGDADTVPDHLIRNHGQDGSIDL